MLPGNDAVKHTAKTALRDDWPRAIAVTMLCFLVWLIGLLLFELGTTLLPPAFSWVRWVFLAVYAVVLIAPVQRGLLRWFWRMLNGIPEEMGSIFYYFSGRRTYFRSFCLTLFLTGKAVGYGVLLLLPGWVVRLLTQPSFYNRFHMQMPYWTDGLRVLSGVLTAAGCIGLCAILLRYYLAPLLLAANEDMLPLEAAHQSTVIARQSLGRFVTLLLGFLGWAVLTVLCLAPFLYAVPFFLTAYAVHGRYAVFHHNRDVGQREGTYFPAFRAQL